MNAQKSRETPVKAAHPPCLADLFNWPSASMHFAFLVRTRRLDGVNDPRICTTYIDCAAIPPVPLYPGPASKPTQPGKRQFLAFLGCPE